MVLGSGLSGVVLEVPAEVVPHLTFVLMSLKGRGHAPIGATSVRVGRGASYEFSLFTQGSPTSWQTGSSIIDSVLSADPFTAELPGVTSYSNTSASMLSRSVLALI